MTRPYLGLLIVTVLAGLASLMLGARVAVPDTGDAPTKFTWMDVYLDAGETPVAAYQLELMLTDGASTIVGIEGGEHPAFREPPHYDPRAIRSERAILAAFTTAGDLPAGRTRIATIHLAHPDGIEPTHEFLLVVAADADGRAIHAELSIEEAPR